MIGFELRVLCLGRILTSKSLTQKQGRAATVAALDLRAYSVAEGGLHRGCVCSSRPAACLQQACVRRGWQPAGKGAYGRFSRGVRHRRAAAPAATAPAGETPPTGAAARRYSTACGGSGARRGRPPAAASPPAGVQPAVKGSALAPPHRPPPARWRRR